MPDWETYGLVFFILKAFMEKEEKLSRRGTAKEIDIKVLYTLYLIIARQRPL